MRHVTTRHDTTRHVTSRHVTSRHLMDVSNVTWHPVYCRESGRRVPCVSPVRVERADVLPDGAQRSTANNNHKHNHNNNT